MNETPESPDNDYETPDIREDEHEAIAGAILPLLFVILAVMLTFKASLHASLGAEVYAERIGQLQNGNFIELIGAYAMKADPVTVWMSQQITMIFF